VHRFEGRPAGSDPAVTPPSPPPGNGAATGNPASTSTTSVGIPRYIANGGPANWTCCCSAALITALYARPKNPRSPVMGTVSRSTAVGCS